MVIHVSTIWIAVIYIGIAAFLGLIGRNRKLGGWTYFFTSLILTPLVGLLLLTASDPRPRRMR